MNILTFFKKKPHTPSRERIGKHQKNIIGGCAGLTTTAVTAHGLLRNSRRKFI